MMYVSVTEYFHMQHSYIQRYMWPVCRLYIPVSVCMIMYVHVYGRICICMYVVLGIEITKRICCPKGWAALPRIEAQKHNAISTKLPLPFLGFKLTPAKSYVTICAT